MPIDPNIALSVKGIEVQDPLVQYGKIAAIQNAQNQNALAQYKLGAEQRAENVQNVLSNAYAKSIDPITGKIDYNKLNSLVASGGAGSQLPAIQKAQTEMETAALTRQKTMAEVLKAKQEFIAQVQRDTSQNPSDANITAYKEDLLANPMFSDDEKQKMLAGADRILAMPFEQRRAFMASQGAKVGELKPTVSVAPGGIVQTPAFGGAATVVPGASNAFILSPEQESQKMRIAQAGKPSTTVLNVQEKAELGARGKMLVGEYENISGAAKNAAKTLPSIESNLAILNQGFDTGFGTGAKAAGAKVLGALGVADAEKYATNSQSFLANASQAVLQKQLEQKGPQTEADAQRITQTGAQLGNTKQANEFLLSVAKAQLKRDMDQRNFYDQWWKQNKTYDGAESAWYSGEGGRSLFDRPELKKFSTGTPNVSKRQIAPGVFVTERP
jgi:hypothetical protein